MTAFASRQHVSQSASQSVPVRSHAVVLLQIFAVAALVFPANSVLKLIGGGGNAAALVAYCIFLAWVSATLFGLHNPLDYRYPVRIALAGLWLVSLASYAWVDRATLSALQQQSADRWLMQLAGVSGVILVAAECLGSLEDVRRVLRALTWAGAFCGIIAGLQFWLKLDLTHYLRLPGFSVNQVDAANAAIGSRSGFNRVPGTAIDPIELGVVASMLLPLAIYLAMYDVRRSKVWRWVPVLCIAVAIPASVSRSGFLAAGVALGVFIVSLSPGQRLIGLAGMLLGVTAIFMTAHGLIGTLKSYFLAGVSDPSIAHRTNAYPLVETLVRQSPLFGQGGGTYIATNASQIFDNEYLTGTVELGLIGLVALIFYFIWPAIAALVARSRSVDPELRTLCAALAGAEIAATLCSATFDSLSFPMFVNIQALVLGLIGATWLLADKERVTGLSHGSLGQLIYGRVNRPDGLTRVAVQPSREN